MADVAVRVRKAVDPTAQINHTHALIPLAKRDDATAIRARHIRLWILRTLNDSPGYRSNDGVLAAALDHVGLPTARADLRQQLQWLASRGYIRADETEHGNAELIVTALREAGQAIVAGTAFDDDIARPAPGRDA